MQHRLSTQLPPHAVGRGSTGLHPLGSKPPLQDGPLGSRGSRLPPGHQLSKQTREGESGLGSGRAQAGGGAGFGGAGPQVGDEAWCPAARQP